MCIRRVNIIVKNLHTVWPISGMEVASFLAEKAKSVSVVDIIKVPFELVLGAKVGVALQKVLLIPYLDF